MADFTELLGPGIELMMLGMGIVFTFLTLLIGTLKVMSAIAGIFSTPEEPQQQTARAVTDSSATNSAHIAVISAAIARFRSTQSA